MLQFRDAFRQLFRDIRSQKLRTFLTVFGIIWGTVAISLLLAFGNGLHKQLVKATAGLGDRIVIAWPGLTSIPFEGLGKGRRVRLTDENIAYVDSQVEGLNGISGEYSNSWKLNYGTKQLAVDVSGVTPIFGDMRNLVPQTGGRFINDLDMNAQRRVVFIGNQLATDIFGEAEAVGKTVMMNGSPFLVIGVLVDKEQDSSYSGRDHSKAFVPSTTFKSISGEEYVDNFVFRARNSGETKRIIDDVRAALGEALRFDETDKEALMIWDTTEQFQFFDMFMLAFNAFLGIIGCLTLIVGGIGVSNIMNVVVEERTREIGIKMAIGARQRWIMTQFLLETLFVTAIGGAIGFVIAIGVCMVFPQDLIQYVGKPEVSPAVAGLTAVVLGLVGLVAGYFPARDAAKLDPVIAMKL
jgi:putative ABC transport system permease protein